MVSICIDGFNLSLKKGTGIATYGRNLLKNVGELGFERQVLYGPLAAKAGNNILNEAVLVDADRPVQKLSRRRRLSRAVDTLRSGFGRRAHSIVPSGEVIWPSETRGLPAADRFWAASRLFSDAHRCFQVYNRSTPVFFDVASKCPAPDVMHWTATLPMYAPKQINIYTIHDLIPLKLPHSTLDDKGKYLELCRSVARRADHICVVSETTRRDVIKILGVDEYRVTNTYQAVDLPADLLARSERDVLTELEGVFGIGWKEYFLYFGAIEPKKNVGRIVEAYLGSGCQIPLIIVGGRAWLDEGEVSLLDQVKRDGGSNANRIRRYDYMPLSLMISLIRGAKATVFPSLYEGFGLPVLESMSLSTPVLTSTAGSLPEVAGDAALLVDPYDVQAISRGLRSLQDDEGLATELVQRGLLQAKKFTPSEYQKRLRALYGAVGY